MEINVNILPPGSSNFIVKASNSGIPQSIKLKRCINHSDKGKLACFIVKLIDTTLF